MFRILDIDRGHGENHAQNTIPDELKIVFTMDDRVNVRKVNSSKTYLGGKANIPIWTKELIENDIDLAKQGMLGGNYGISKTNALREGLKHTPPIENERVIVIGGQIPWVAACVLEAGARAIVTLEYGKIISQHTIIRTMIPTEFRWNYLNGTLGTFDAVVTFSSMEHSGLGKYGDALNPWEILAIAKAWCVTREGGSLTIGVLCGRFLKV